MSALQATGRATGPATGRASLPARAPRNPARRRRAFSLVELLLASACTVSIVTAGSTMVLAVSASTADSLEDRAAYLQGHGAMRRLTRLIQNSRMIGFWDIDEFVLWRGDANGDDLIQLSETISVWYDNGTSTLKSTRPFRESMTAAEIAAADRTVDPTELMDSGFPSTIRSAANAATQVMATNVVSFEVDSNAPGQRAKLLSLELKLRPAERVLTYCITVSPRAVADYLCSPSDNTDDGDVTRRKRRLNARVWNVPGVTAGD